MSALLPLIAVLLLGFTFAVWLALHGGFDCRAMAVGSLTFILAVLVLEYPIIAILKLSSGSMAFGIPAVIIVAIIIMAPGLFEETGRMVAYACMGKGKVGLNAALSFGVGCGLTEAIVNASLALIVSSSAFGGFAVVSTEDLYAIVERLAVFAAQIGFSVIVWFSTKSVIKLRFVFLAILLHCILDAGAHAYHLGLVSLVWSEIYCLFMCVLICIVAFKLLSVERMGAIGKTKKVL